MTDLHWIAAGDYQLALDGTTITAKNAKGRVLKTVPAKAKKTPEYEQLNNCRIYLEQHQKECLRQVSEWFLKGLPVPVRGGERGVARPPVARLLRKPCGVRDRYR